MEQTRIVVLGGGYSGMMAARRLAHNLRGQQVQITLVNAAPHFVQRVRLHQLAAEQKPEAFSLRDALQPHGIRFMQAKVTRIDPQVQALTVQTAAGSQTLAYDYLIYALGSYVDMSVIPGLREHALSLATEATAAQLRDQLPTFAGRGGRLVICGGGLTGIEAATEFAEAYPGLKVTLLTRDTFGAQLSRKGRDYTRQVFKRLGIEIRDQLAIQAITADAIEYEGGSMAYDACLWAGAFTVPPLARESGLKVNTLGQIITDDRLRSVTDSHIYAIGDSADISAAIGTPIRMACATALPMGVHVANELADRLKGREHRPYEFMYYFRCISLGRKAGLVQMVDPNDAPKESILTGRVGAAFKEMICKYTTWQVRHPRWTFLPRRPASERTARETAVVGVR